MRRRAAFTLIELLAATALAAMLMVLLLSVSTTIARERQTMARVAAKTDDASMVLDLLRTDLANARTVRTRPGRVVLSGYGALDPATLTPTHQRARVVYELERRGPLGCLVREQRLLNSRSLHNSRVDLVLAGVKSFALQVPRPPQPQGARSTGGRRGGAGGNPGGGTRKRRPRAVPVPDEASLRLTWQTRGKRPLSARLMIH